MKDEEYIKGRGAQLNSLNPFDRYSVVQEHWEGVDEPEDQDKKTKSEYIEVFPKTILNRVDSPDIGLMWSMNPYQGCEHGCIYCYARNTHNYWGYSAGTEFEQKILIKKNAPSLLRAELSRKNWNPEPIMFSGNTDCYQPAERKFGITRGLLEVLLEFRHPAGMITKNALILRDLDILKQLNKHNLIHVNISFTSLNEETRRIMEPRTSSVKSKLQVIRTLAENDIPVGVMMAPIIPSINSHEIFDLVKAVAGAGAHSVNYTIVRLNGAISDLFEDWIRKNYPDRAEKVLNQIKHTHGGKLNDSRFGARMRGEGQFAETVRKQMEVARRKFLPEKVSREFNLDAFVRRNKDQLMLF